jgi:hypothetical protein
MAFERYVRSLLDINIRVTRWTKMQWARGPRADEDSFDFCLRDTTRDRGFFLECMYRSGLREGKLLFHTAEKIGRWQEVSGRLGMPVCVAIGLGGSPENPSRMFIFDLGGMKWPELFPSFFERHEVDPKKQITMADLEFLFR